MLEPQVALSKALEDRNLKEFRLALAMDGDPSLLDEKNLSIFEKSLQTYGCAEFVRECLSRGCRVDYTNRQLNKTPINFAVESRDPEIIKTLLENKGVPVNTKVSNLTPLNTLAKNITSENYQHVFECIKILLRYGANPNIPDQTETTPILYIIKSKNLGDDQKLEVAEHFLLNSNVDLDTFRDGEARRLLERKFPNVQLPKPFSAEITIESLKVFLTNDNEDRFLKAFKEHQLNLSEKDNQMNSSREEYQMLLEITIKRGHNLAFDCIIATGIDVNRKFTSRAPIEVAVIYGNCYALQRLLEHANLNLSSKENLLITVIKKFDEVNYNNFSDYSKCFYILLDSKKIDINETDESGTSALHYAVRYKNERVMLELMDRGAYIGTRSQFNDLPITDMNPEILEDYLDSCITINNYKQGDANFKIFLNFKNLIPPSSGTVKSCGKGSPLNIKEEMAPISHISKSKEHRHLLKHPLITSFLFLKWHRLSLIFYINFLMYTLFCVSLMTFIVLTFNDKSENTGAIALFGILTAVGLIYIVLREILQFIISPRAYLQSSINVMEWILILLTINALLMLSYEMQTKRILLALTILLAAMELCLLVGALPFLSISTHMLMLREVSRTFLKSFTLYSMFVITFSLCFYILFSPKEEETSADGEEGELNKFRNPFTAIIKTIVMMTGEFDAGDIDFHSYYSYFVFILFVFFMSIVLLNLLNGLAVSDTQVIKSQAELNGSICRANVLRKYEVAFIGSTGRASFLINHRPFRTICKRLTNLFPPFTTNYQIAILPNENNKICVPNTNIIELSDLEANNDLNQNEGIPLNRELNQPGEDLTCCCWFKCSEMDVRTVKTAINILEQSQQKSRNRIKLQETENRLKSIEDKIGNIAELLQELNSKS